MRKKRVCELKHLKRIKLYCSKGLLRKKEQRRRLEQLSMLFKVKKIRLIVSKFSIIRIIVINKIIILKNNHHNSRDINQHNLYNLDNIQWNRCEILFAESDPWIFI